MNLNPTLNIDSVTAGQCLAEAENPDKQFEGDALADSVLVIDRRNVSRDSPLHKAGIPATRHVVILSQSPGRRFNLTGAFSRRQHPVLSVLFVARAGFDECLSGIHLTLIDIIQRHV